MNEETIGIDSASGWIAVTNPIQYSNPYSHNERYSQKGLYDFVWYEKERGDIYMDDKIVAKDVETLKQKTLIAFLKAYPELVDEIENYELKFRKWG